MWVAPLRLAGNTMISQVLKIVMFKKDINTSQLARDINLPQQTLQRIVSGVSPRPHSKTLQTIADFFEITLEQLKGKQPLPQSLLDMGLPIIATQAKAKEIPIVLWDAISNYSDAPKTYTASEYIYAEATLPDTTFAVILPDTSMEPFFQKNSVIILDAGKTIKDRCFVLAKIAETNTYLFRQLLVDGDQQYLKPINPDFNAFAMRLLKVEDKILGVMLESRHRAEH